ncbi:hypothetical protein BX600DRAFT_441815 [Xylariales sp. PMI_506]|nr:hypothetical protein BX600DRAFT_441815 [Xylariales sp. PMI_506]
MGGLLLPPWFQASPISSDDENLASLFFGFSLCQAIFTAYGAAKHTLRFYRRGRLPSTFITLLWCEWVASLSMAFLCRFACAPQIIINRIYLISESPRRVTKIKWGVAGILGLMNIMTAAIWVPARLEINPTFVAINRIWDPIEKAVFAVVDLGLNIYFIHLVKSNLIKEGITKFSSLLYFNIAMVVISITMDIHRGINLGDSDSINVRIAKHSLHGVPPALVPLQTPHRNESCPAHCQGCQRDKLSRTAESHRNHASD